MNKTTSHIVILGAGYGGLMTAIRLAGKTKKQNVAITLVNGNDHFVERIRLHEQAVGTPLKQRPIAKMLRGTKVNFVQGWVKSLHPRQHEVTVTTTTETRQIKYDTLVLALGSHIDQDMVPGVRENALVLNPFGEGMAGNLEETLRTLNVARGRVLIVGGGATGIEVAAQAKGYYPSLDVKLLTKERFGAFKNERVRSYFVKIFQKHGIDFVEHTEVSAIHPKEAELATGEKVPFDLCIWAGGFKASPIARDAGLKVNGIGQVWVDPYLRSLSHPDIYAIGDAAIPVEYPGAPFRMSVFTAMVSGAHTADNLARRAKNKSQKPLSYAYYGQGIAVGPKDGIGFLTFPADKASRPYFKGRLGLGIRNFFVAFLVWALAIERRIPGFFFWLGKGRYRAGVQNEPTRQTSYSV